MLLLYSVLLWLTQIIIVQSQFPLMNLFKPIQQQIQNSIPNILQFQQPQPKTQEDLVAETRLKKCCQHLDQADPQCKSQYCSFDAFSADKALIFMTMCAPRGPTVGQMWDCASSRRDHTECCRSNGVGQECMMYCQTTNGVPNDPSIYMNCFKYFNAIKSCFRQYLSNNPNLYGET